MAWRRRVRRRAPSVRMGLDALAEYAAAAAFQGRAPFSRGGVWRIQRILRAKAAVLANCRKSWTQRGITAFRSHRS
jgi:hypothetical protein